LGPYAKNYRPDGTAAINDKGQIVALTFDNSAGAFCAVLLTPLSPWRAILGAVVTTAPNSGEGRNRSQLIRLLAASKSHVRKKRAVFSKGRQVFWGVNATILLEK